MKPKLYLINGALGAGKTTIVTHLIAQSQFKKARIIENEFANTSIDTERFHDHGTKVETIAGLCICCSTGEELDDALRRLASVSSDPVIIEATGLANSLKLVEKLVVSGILNQYQLASAMFVVNAAALAREGDTLLEQYRDEIKAADIVVVTKMDLLDKKSKDNVLRMLANCEAKQIVVAAMGRFDTDVVARQSSILDYYVDHAEELRDHDVAMSYTVIDTAGNHVKKDNIIAGWNMLKDTYRLLRMKGGITTDEGMFHVEATPEQCLIYQTASKNTRLVFIGKDARRITRDIVKEVL